MKIDFKDKRGFLSAVKKLTRVSNITHQIMLQEVILDNLIDRITHSKYNNNLIIKGGFLIGSLIGMDLRSTRDVDTSVKGLLVTKDKISDFFMKSTKFTA